MTLRALIGLAAQLLAAGAAQAKERASTLPPNVRVPGADDPIVYVPRRGVWRVTFDGSPVWLLVPDVDAARLERAISGLRPHAAPARWL